MRLRAFGLVFVALLPGAAGAQPLSGSSGSAGFDASGHPYGPTSCAPQAKQKHRHGAGVTIHGYPYGPWVAPPWGYPGLAGGPFVTYPPFPGYFGYSGRAGSSWSNGLSLYGPPVPVYGPIPGVFGNDDLVRQWRATLAPGFAGYGWIGLYAASPHPRHRPPTVSVWPEVESLGAPPVAPAPANVGGCLVLSVKVPQPGAEVLVDGQKTAQSGTDRTFESPPLEAGKSYRYTVTARWVEGGQAVEMSKEVTGTPGEVVRVDFGTPIIATGK